MAEPTAFQGAEGAVDTQKRALLAAIAQQGSAGQAQFDAQRAQAEEVKKQAVAATAERTSKAGAPMSLIKQLGASATAVADTYRDDAARGQWATAVEGNRMAAANGNYMDEVKAAVPIARTVAKGKQDRIIAEIEAEAKARADAEAARQQSMDFAREQQGWNREDRVAGQADQAEDRAWTREEREASRADQAADRDFQRETQGWSREDRDRAWEERYQERAWAVEDRNAEQGSKPQAPLSFDVAARNAGLSPSQMSALQGSSAWKSEVPEIAADIAGGATREQVLAGIRSFEAEKGHGYPMMEKVVMEMFFGSGASPTSSAPAPATRPRIRGGGGGGGSRVL